MLSCEYCEILKNSIFTKYLRWLLLYFQEKKFSSILLLRTPIRSSPLEVMLWKCVLKICSKFTGEDPCRSIILMLQNSFIEITLWHGCSPLNLFHSFITRFPKNTWKAAPDKWNQEWAYAVYGSGFSD